MIKTFKHWVIPLILTVFSSTLQAQEIKLNHWKFKKQDETKWYTAQVPGNIFTDLLNNHLIKDPFFNEKELIWVSHNTWVYQTQFLIPKSLYKNKITQLNFEGIDTYSEIFLNGVLIGKTDNMFCSKTIELKSSLLKRKNILTIKIYPVNEIIKQKATQILPIKYPDNDRVFVRKAAYQFGWDWGPNLPGAGIWKKVSITILKEKEKIQNKTVNITVKPLLSFHQEADSFGINFYFKKENKPFFIKGANWIPADIFPSRITFNDYKILLTSAKEAGINMLRVWGGGIYEDDIFYNLCDSLEISIWQDFMFANAMYPYSKENYQTIKNEIKQQILRLSKHKSVVLWCGNNEIEEAWRHWGWQQTFNIHNNDSTLIWKQYKSLFQDSIATWINQYDPLGRKYISTSPKYGWGNPRSLTDGDSHYWGFWWGYQDWEIFKHKTGRFVSEWGMQALPSYPYLISIMKNNHEFTFEKFKSQFQKANDGNKKLQHYFTRYFIDSIHLSKLSIKKYTYLSQCLQYYIVKNILLTQMNQFPKNMGTMIWQYNDCWPAISWSITDYSHSPKGGWYALKKCFTEDNVKNDPIYPKNVLLEKPYLNIKEIDEKTFSVSAMKTAKFIYITYENKDLFLSDNFFDLNAGEQKVIQVLNINKEKLNMNNLTIISLYDILSRDNTADLKN